MQVYNTARAIEIFCQLLQREILSWVGRRKISDVWNGNSVDQAVIVLDLDPTFSNQFESQGVNAVFNL